MALGLPEHFIGFRAVLPRLDRITADRLEEIITEAWAGPAPQRLVAEFLAEHPPADRESR